MQGTGPLRSLRVPHAFCVFFHPRRDVWSDHFAWDESFELIIGLTPVGRATIDALQLNRQELVNLRRMLYAAGQHPLPDL